MFVVQLLSGVPNDFLIKFITCGLGSVPDGMFAVRTQCTQIKSCFHGHARAQQLKTMLVPTSKYTIIHAQTSKINIPEATVISLSDNSLCTRAPEKAATWPGSSVPRIWLKGSSLT